jgi:tagatose 1,6-diphosphate aldolase
VRGGSVQFYDPGDLRDGDLRLVLRRTYRGSRSLGLAPTYAFDMTHADSGARMGEIDLRLSNEPYITHYAGHIGYAVERAFRGHRYAARACGLLLPLARQHDLSPLWITCNPDNVPSRKTCEHLGATLVEVVPVPPESDLYRRGEREKCRYRVDLDAILVPEAGR